MAKLSLKDVKVSGKKVLVRVDFNVPLDESGRITSDKRIQATLPTITYLLKENAAVILMSHLGRPKGKVEPSMSLKPVAKRLSELLNREVKMAPDCVGAETEKMAADLKNGEVLLLENLRFHPEEEKNDKKFARSLAALGEIFIQEAFGTVHRAHASTVGIVEFVKTAAVGFLVEKEIENLSRVLDNPQKPLLAILGGAKVSDKIAILENLVNKVDALIIGGAMAYTFLKAKGIGVGKSRVEEDRLDDAKKIMQAAVERKIRILLPIDHIAVSEISPTAVGKHIREVEIPEGLIGVDIGPSSVERFAPVINTARTIFWNGPLGVFEIEQFGRGTVEIARLVARATENGTISIVGGGDSASAIKKAGVEKSITHISTGGGASLEFMEGKELPGLAVIKNK